MEERIDPPAMASAPVPARRPAAPRRTLLTLLAAGGLAFAPLPALADPDPATSDQAALLMADSARDLEIASERVNEARERLRMQTDEAEQAADDVAAAEAALAEARSEVATVARSAWTGTQVGTLEAMLTSESVDQMLDRVGTLTTIARYNGGVLTEASAAGAEADAAKTEAEAAAAEAATLVRRFVAQQETLDRQVAAYKAEYERLRGEEQAAREAAERAAAERSAARAARAAEREERAERAVRAERPAAAPDAPPAPAARTAPARVAGGSGAAGTAVATALGQAGDPYSWGAAGPNAFDCSGLTQYAWAAAGVSLPHSSSMQSRMGSPVSRSALQPGDLLFFYSPVSHVAMYVGNGQMVQASTYGQPVKVVPIGAMPSYSHARRVG